MSVNHMRFGIFLAPFHPNNENPTLAIDRDMALVQHLDTLDYDEAWIGEHHSGGFEIISSPEIFCAAAAQVTKHIKLGSGVISLPYHNPFMIANRVTQLDHMTRGRFMFGFGPGALAGDAYRMGVDPEQSRRMMHEAIDVIMPLLRGEMVNAETDWFKMQDARLQLPAYTEGGPEVAVASSRSPTGALAAGRHGTGMLSIGGTSDAALEAHSKNWATCEETAAQNGQTVSRDNWRMVTLMHVAETRQKARDNVAFGLKQWTKYFSDVATFPIIPPGVDDPMEYLIESKSAMIGTPDDACEFIDHLMKGTGGFGALMQLAHNWADWEQTKRSYELIARYVAPHFRGSNSLRQFSYDYSTQNREKFVNAAAASVENAIKSYEAQSGKEWTNPRGQKPQAAE
jgi:limonene 1,2-monooxygenase